MAESRDRRPGDPVPGRTLMDADTVTDVGAPLPSLDADSPRSTRAPVHTGAQLGSYILDRRVGVGGAGEVFDARHSQTGERVALKILSSTTAIRLYRFKREFRALADITHPNLVRLHELLVPQTGPAFFTMELIDGVPFVSWVRGQTPIGELPDIERLTAALRQLVEGVQQLHAHGFVHRDLKPANVLVTEAGRVVILDLGLVAGVDDDDGGVTHERQILGTPAFMAPEQAAGMPAEPAVDLYAIGVMLYQCMSGQLPHRSSGVQLLVDKQQLTAPDPAEVVANIPDWLRSLCVRLLARDPATRPSTRDILARLPSIAPHTIDTRASFVGRAHELAALHAALARVIESQAPVVVQLSGASGVGKSTLCRRFRAQLDAGSTTTLHGRCGKNETVPYKGVDAIVDHLSASLRRLPEATRAQLRPPALDSLVRMFPVLDDIWPQTEAPTAHALDETRRLGASSLRALLLAFAQLRTLVLHIDDFQWADDDSASLLGALLRPPGAPALLLLLSHRTDAEGGHAHGRLDELADVVDIRPIELAGLSNDEACQLASELLAQLASEPSPAGAESIAFRARGSPLFITQTVLGGRSVADEQPELEQIVARRLLELDPIARQLLDVVAVYGAPISVELALELVHEANEATIQALCRQGLLLREAAGLETAHDRVREVALTALSPAQRSHWHIEIGGRLRNAYEDHRSGDRLFALANHLDAGVEDMDALAPELRLDLAQLNQRAGHRAMQSTAWSAAFRYFDYARRLLEPWLADARLGRGEHQLCFDVVFGWCQVAFFLEREDADAVVDDLVTWSLSTSDHCRVAQWYCEFEFLKARFAEVVRFGPLALTRIGFPTVQHPSSARAVALFIRGWRSVWRTGLDDILARPEISDERTRAALDIAALTSSCAGFVSITQQLASMGAYCLLLARHGLHDWAAVALSGLALSAVAVGNDDKGRQVLALTLGVVAARQASASASASAMAQLMLVVVMPTLRPVHDAVVQAEAAYTRARAVDQRVLIENIGVMNLLTAFLAGQHVAKIAAFSADLRRVCKGFTFAHMREQIDELDHCSTALLEGRARLDVERPLGDSLHAGQRGFMLVVRLMAAVLLGDHDGAWVIVERLTARFPSDIQLLWPAAVFPTLAVIVLATRRSPSTAHARRIRRQMRRHRRTVARWAVRCPENFQPMLDAIDAELARATRRPGVAVDAYERALNGTRTNGMTWLDGIVSERLAEHLANHGHDRLAGATLRAARDAYAALGATAVVQRIVDAQRGTID